MYRAVITVTLRTSILDPQGKTIELSLHQLGYTNVSGVRTGKHIELLVDAPSEENARETVELVSSKLLANPVMEDFSYRIYEFEGEKNP
jgi:phosphoribosylformylglycinamidine synthase subunit PurS